jgi:MoxR-like ATPase
MKILVGYPTPDEERRIYRVTTGSEHAEPARVLNGKEVLELQQLVRRIPISDLLIDYTMTLMRATRPGQEGTPDFIKRWVSWGVGPRGGQWLILASKARAALNGRPEVGIEDLMAIAPSVLRHRIVLNYSAEAEGQTPDTIIARLLESIPLHGTSTRVDGQLERVFKS